MRRRALALATLVTMASGAYAGYALAGSGGSGGSTDTITMRDFRFVGVNANYEPGTYTFTFRNQGEFTHNFRIVYVAQGRKFGVGDVAPGSSRQLTVNLRPGSYVAVCTVFNGYHVSQGMIRRFTVGEIDFETGRWS